MKKLIIRSALAALTIIVILTIYAWVRTIGKTDIEFRIHINEQLVLESSFGESPTFAIWFEDVSTGHTKTAFVTRRAAEGDWEGKAEVPVALPKWFEIQKNEDLISDGPENEKSLKIDAATGATPVPGYFIKRVGVEPQTSYTIWIEVNLAGDFNEYFLEYNEELHQEDEFLTGQPALLYKAEIKAVEGLEFKPEIVGMCILNKEGEVTIQPLQGITTASDIFDEISIRVVQPRPRIIKKTPSV